MARALRLPGVTLLALLALAIPASAQNPEHFGTFSIGQVEIQLEGDFSEYSLASGTLPPGVELKDHTPPWFPPTHRVGLSGIATTPGFYDFFLMRGTVAEHHTVTITALSLQDGWNLPDQYVDKAFSYQLTALNNAGAVTFALSFGAPPGVTLDAGGLISGTPTQSGFYNIGFTVNDGTDTIFRSVNVSVYAIEITTPGLLPNATQNQFYSTVLTASGGAGGYQFSTSGLPFGLTLAADGTLSGTMNFAGLSSFNVSVVDSMGISRDQRFSLPVDGVPPRVAQVRPYGSALDECTFGVPCTLGVHVQNGGRAPFTWSAMGLPAGMDIRFGDDDTTWWINPGDAELWGVPMALGVFDVTLTVTDADGKPSTQTFSLAVRELFQTDFLFGGTYGAPFSQAMRVIGGRQPHTAAIVGGRLPLGLALDPATLTVSGVPAEHGSFDFLVEFTDDDGLAMRRRQFIFISGVGTTININEGGDLGFFTEGFFLSRQLNACCVPSQLWTFVDGALPGGVALSSGGLLSGTPAAGSAGPYTFTARVEDATNATNFAIRQFTFRITAIQVITGTIPTGNVGTPYSTTLQATGSGPFVWTLEPLSYLPPGITLSPDGVLSGTATARGQFSFAVLVTNPLGDLTRRFFSTTIFGAGETPPLEFSFGPNFGTFLLGSNSFQFFPIGGTPPIAFAYAPGPTDLPGFRVQNGPPYPTFFSTSPAPAAALLGVHAAPGEHVVTVRATDSLGQFIDRTATIRVTGLNVLQSAMVNATVGVPYSFQLTPYGGTAYSFSSTNMPAGLAVSASGLVQGTPTAAGFFFPTIALTDLATATTITVNVPITIDPFAITTGAVLPSATVGVFYSQPLTHGGCTGACTWSGFGFPQGLSIDAGGTISGTPPGQFNGSVTVTLVGSNGTVSKRFGLRVNSAAPSPLNITTGSVFGDTTIGSTPSQTLFVQGGTAPYAWTLESGALPPGISMDGPGETLIPTTTPGATILFGRAMQVGVYGFTLRVTDGVGATTTRAFTWRVSPLLSHFNSLPLAGNPLVYNTPYSQGLLVVGGTGSYTFTSGPLPPGLTLDASTGVISGTPLNTGFFSGVPVTATDGNGDSLTFFVSFNIASGTPVALSVSLGQGLFTVQQGATPNVSVNVTGGTPPYTVTALTPLPPGLFLSGPAGPITGVASTPGTYAFTLEAMDSAGNIGVRTFSTTVAPFAIQPGITNLPDGSVGVPYSHTLTTLGTPGTTWAVTFGSLPDGLTLSASGEIAGTPTSAGTFNVTATATAANGVSVGFGLTFRISSIVIADGGILPPATFGVPYVHALDVSGGGTGKVFTANGLPGGFSISSAGVISGTSTATNTVFQSIAVIVTDTSGTLLRRFVLPLTTPNPAVLNIAVGSEFVELTVGQVQSFTLAANGGVGPYTWSVAGGSTLPPGFSLLPAPAGNFPPGVTVLTGIATTAGTHVFDLVVTDAIGTSTRRTFTLRVSTIGFLPTNAPTLPAGVAASVQFSAFGGMPPYTYSLAPVGPNFEMLPPGTTFSPSGLFSGTPTSTGPYAAMVTVQDSAGATLTRRVNITVVSAPSNLFVNMANPIGNIGRRLVQTLTLGLSGPGSLPASTNWSVVSGSLPPGTMLVSDPAITGQNNATVLVGQPTMGGMFTYTLRGTDAADVTRFAERRFTAIVNGMQLVLMAPIPAGHVGEPYSLQLRVAGGTAPYAFTATGALPAGMTLSAGGLVSGTPETIGVHTIGFTVSDSAGASQNAAVSFVVTQPGVPSPLIAQGIAPTINDVLVGVPFAAHIQQWVRGGVLPYTFTLAPASSLPPGVTIIPGGNGVPAYLGGIPTTPGDYSFDLIINDSAGQSVTATFTARVVELGFTVASLPPARVGTPYSLSLGPTGGAPPYTVTVSPLSDLPAGLTMSAAGVLSGTPTSVGTFALSVTLTDSLGAQATQFYRFTVDNPAGEAPAISLSPTPIEIYYELGAPAPVVPVSVNRTSGMGAFTLNLPDAPWANLSATGGTAPFPVNLSIGTVEAGTYFGVLGGAGESANFVDPVPIKLTVVPPPPCTYSLNPTAASMPAGGGTGGFDVAAGAACGWSAIASDTWITITGGASGTGAGTVSFSVAANGAADARGGSISVNGEVFTITQFGAACSFAINPLSIGAPASGGTAQVSVTASSACGATEWTAVGLGATPASGSGNGTVTVTIPPNFNAAGQVLNATIAGRLFTVNQAGAACSVALSAPGAAHGASGGNGAVSVTTPAGCPYSTVLGPSWISVTSGGSGTGSGTLVYSVEANSTTFPRSGTLVIGGASFTISQEALACSATVDTSALGSPMPSGGGNGSIAVTMNGPNCAWTASSAASWATVLPVSSDGSGNVVVTVASNAASTTPRATELTVAGQTIALSQAGTECTYSLLSATGSVPSGGGAGSVGVVAPAACGWTSASNDPAWLTISSSGTGGSGSVSFVAQPNPASTPRSGTLTIAGLAYTVNQAAADCSYTLTPTNTAVAAEGASGSFAISTGTVGCAPNAVSYAGWAAVTTTFAGTSGTVEFTVTPNPSALTRVGIIQVGGASFTITQLGAACAYSLSSYGAYFNSLGGSSSFLGSGSGLGCVPDVGVDLPSIVTLGALSGPVSNIFTQPFEVSPFTGQLTPVVRRARITFGGTIFVVKQSSY